MWWILRRICFKAKEDETMAVVTMTQWARIHAKAWLDNAYKDTLEKDPRQAVDEVRVDFGIRDDAKLFDINDPTYGGGTDESGSEPQFDKMTKEELEKVIKEGKLGKAPNERTAKMIPSEWISYPPLYTKSNEAPDDGSTLSLPQWARILAYLHRFKIADSRFPSLKHHYENDPAAAVEAIVHGGRVKGERDEFDIGGLKGEFKDAPAIPYVLGKTALFRLGDPPNPKQVNLQEVLANPNGYARVMVRICC
jgi:hypothetical protein